MQKVDQNFNLGLALIGLSGTGPSWSLRFDDGDGNENFKKAIGLISKTIT